MRARVGVDLVYLPRFRKVMGKIRDTVFSPSELKSLKDSEAKHKSCYGRTVQSAYADLHIAGIFAAKEAVMKALSLKAGSWLNIEVANKKSGKPVVKLAKNLSKGKIVSCDLSISHDGDYAMAVFVALVE
ncbi:holo-ACP synthase [Candidatus Woesearchaeota archaeon]|nr:holo-ACP synthase [Candidatus Woesearchaeota archaeon]